MLHLSGTFRLEFRLCAALAGVAVVLAGSAGNAGAPSSSDSQALPAAADSLALLWPTDAGRCPTSTFGEFRPGHFHSGLDISTGGEIGADCFAVADGDLVRARVSCGGYGRSVYLRLADGRTAVYAHLSRFVGALADSVRSWQEREGSMYFDRSVAPGVFPVRRGDVVAISGQSGVGVPHLHVEIRDAEERPLDPLRQGLGVADTVPPVITRIALTPLGPLASVDGRSDTVILDVASAASPGEGRVEHVVPVEGRIGIAVEVRDHVGGCRYRLAPARFELREKGELLYGVDYARISFAESEHIDFQIDPRFSYTEVGRFHRLWREPGNPLSLADSRAPTDGILRALRIPARERRLRVPLPADDARPPALAFEHSVQKPGEKVRSFTVIAEDAAGNRGRAIVELSFAPPPRVTTLAASLARSRAAASPDAISDLETAWADTMIVSGTVRTPGRGLAAVELEYSLDFGKTWLPGDPVLPDASRSFGGRIPFLHRVPGEGRQNVLLRALAVDVLGAASIAKSVVIEGSLPPPPGNPEFEIVTQGRWLELRLPETIPWGSAGGGWMESERPDGSVGLDAVLVRPWGRGLRLVFLPGEGESRVLELPGNVGPWRGYDPWGRPVALPFELPGWTADSLAAGRCESPGKLAVYEFAAGVFREPAAVLVHEEPAPPAPGGLRPVGQLHSLLAGQVPLAASYRLALRAQNPEDFASDRVGIFVQEPDGFRYIGGEKNAELGAWIVDARTLLPVGLYEDRVAPRIDAPRLAVRRGRVELRFRVEDEGAGVGCDAIRILCDGVPVLYELDDETGDVVAYPPLAPLDEGESTYISSATDRCGNHAERVDTMGLK